MSPAKAVHHKRGGRGLLDGAVADVSAVGEFAQPFTFAGAGWGCAELAHPDFGDGYAAGRAGLKRKDVEGAGTACRGDREGREGHSEDGAIVGHAGFLSLGCAPDASQSHPGPSWAIVARSECVGDGCNRNVGARGTRRPAARLRKLHRGNADCDPVGVGGDRRRHAA